MPVRKRGDEVFRNAAGIDIGPSSHWVVVPPHTTDDAVRGCGPMTTDLNALADWLLASGVDTVALESTSVYWIPVHGVLEQHGLQVWLGDTRQLKYVPGRKSDVQDCQWLHKLMSLGLLREAWRPDGEVCVVRAVARQREVLRIEKVSWVQRMQKALVQMNIQLTEVLSEVMGMTGQAIIRAIVAGERNELALAQPGPQDGSDELVAQSVRPRRPLPKTERANGQAPGEHRYGPQAGPGGVLHAQPGRGGLHRPGPAALRGAAAPAQHRRLQTPSRRTGLPDPPRGDGRVKSAFFSFVS